MVGMVFALNEYKKFLILIFILEGIMKQNLNEFAKVTAILRGYEFEQIDYVIGLLVNSSIKAVEITLNHADSKNIIKTIVKKYGQVISIGAGTVLTKEDLIDVIKCGVEFVLSPTVFDKDMIDYCKTNDVISVPGALSPSEIYQNLKLGADIVKVFPAARFGSTYFKDISAPLGKVPLMAVGGINGENMKEYFTAGAKFVGISSGLFDSSDIKNCDEIGLKKSLNYFNKKYKEFIGE